MSYSDQTHADAHFALKLSAPAWDNAISADKDKALSQATLILNQISYSGGKTDPDQVDQFPRDESTVVPNDIKIANDEIAYALLDGVDPSIEYENLKMTQQGYGNVRSTYDRQDAQPHVLAGVPSATAWRYITPYLNDPRLINLQRV